MALDRFELLELRRDDGIKMFHAREVSTARPVQVHLFVNGSVQDNLALLSSINRLPDAERRRVIDRGVSQGKAYVVTDRLSGFAGLREWLEAKATPVSLDQQFHELFGATGPQLPGEAPLGPPAHHIAAKSLLGLILGIFAAVLFLVFLIIIFVFRPR